MSSLTSYLARKGAVDPARLQRALLNQAIKGGSPSLSLLEVEAIDEDRLLELTGQFHHLRTFTTAACLAGDPEAARSVSRARCEEHGVVPVGREEGQLLVACVEPPTRMELRLIEKEAGCRVLLVVASPLSLALALTIFHGVPLDPRVRAVIAGRGDGSLDLGGVPADVARKVDELLSQGPGPEGAAVDEAGDGGKEDEEDWTWDEEDGEDDGDGEQEQPGRRESVVGKYIIINRIGARPRRPSLRPRVSMVRRADRERVAPTETEMEADVTFSSGDRKVGKDTRPHHATRPPGQQEEPRPERKTDTVPPAVLKEVIDDYLSNDGGSPSPARPAPGGAPRGRAGGDVRVVRTVSASPDRQVSEPIVPEERTTLPTADPGARSGRKTVPGAPSVIDAIRKAPRPAVPGYAVEVDEPLGLSSVLQTIERSEKASEITDAVQRFALQFFDFVLVMRYRKGRFEITSVSSRGWAWPVDRLPVRLMGYDQLPGSIRKLGQPYLGPVEEGGRTAEILSACGRPLPPSAIMFPITIKGRAVVVIYGDNGTRPSSFEEVNDLFHATWVATNRIVELLEERMK
jgi:hypothetical protein